MIRVFKYGIAYALCAVLAAGFAGCSSSNEASESGTPTAKEIEVVERDPDQALQYFIAGSIHEKKGEFEEAARQYEIALKYDDDPSIIASLATCYVHLERQKEAMEYANLSVQKDPDNLEFRERLADLYISFHQLDSAKRQYEYIVEHDKDNLQAKFTLGRLYQYDEPQKALEMFEEVNAKVGDDWDIGSRMAEIYSDMGELDKAAEALESLKRIDPENEMLLQTLASLYLELAKYDEALALYETLSEKSPDNISYNLSRAELYLRKNDWNKASGIFQNVVKSDALTIDDAMRIGDLYFNAAVIERFRMVEAIDLFHTLQQRFPNDWRPEWYLGATYFNNGNATQAIPYLERVVEVLPENVQALDVLARSYLLENRYSDAVRTLNNIVSLGVETSDVYGFLGYAYRQMGNGAEAETALQRALDLDAANMDALSTLALLYDDKQEYDRSDELYSDALELYEHGEQLKDDTYYLLLNNYAYALSERQDKLDEAQDMSRTAVEFAPENSSYLDTYGWIQYQRGNYEEARTYIEKAVALRKEEQRSPGAVLLDHLADIYLALGNNDRALALWREALESYPENSNIKEKIERYSR